MKDFKSLLKEAREAIKNKDFQSSMKICKNILKEDKSNYMGLVFLGLSLQEIGPIDQAPKAFKKAIQIQNDNPLAWNGLVNYYEKIEELSDEDKKDLVKAYLSLIKFETNDKKVAESVEKVLKLLNFAENKLDLLQAIIQIKDREKFGTESFENVLKNLASYFDSCQEKLSAEELLIYYQTLEALLSNKNTVNYEYFSSYLTLLYKEQKFDELVLNAERMSLIYESNTLPHSWICKLYNQFFVEENKELIQRVEDRIENSCLKLLQLDPNNSMGLFTKSLLEFKSGNIETTKNLLVQVTNSRPGLVHAWVFLTKIYLKLNLTEEANFAASKADKLLQTNYSNKNLSNIHIISQMEVYSKSNEHDDWIKAEKLFDSISDENVKEQCLYFILEVKIKLKKFNEIKEIVSDLKDRDEFLYKLLSAKIHRHENKFQEALKILEACAENYNQFEWWIEIGLNYWALKDYNKCLMPFLKAAKCNPDNYLIFVLLGNYYLVLNDLDKARRCFEKAVKISPRNAQASTELSSIYRKQKNWEANVSLLQNLTTGVINKKNYWAWLQLGLNYLEQGNFDNAIDNLRLVIRVDPNNMHCWEALADAYFARGAFTSALKSYQKAAELSSNNPLYPCLQIANIKKILGEFADAKQDFEAILNQNGQYVPALKGLAETCLYQARKCSSEQRLGTARDHAQYGIEKITIAIYSKSEMSCLWKIFSDLCLFVARMPNKYCFLQVSKSIAEGSVDFKNEVVSLSKDQMFELAARCYCKSLSLLEDNIWLWHDLGVCYLHHAMSLKKDNTEKSEQLFSYALAAAQFCIDQDCNSWQHWNLLGSVEMSRNDPNYSLAQHAFIKAVTIDHNSAISWANLGTLYLIQGDIKLANMAFAQGQRSDPNYVNSWIGQALIAESMGHEDAMDLFRHTTELGAQQQGALGYGQYVCRTLLDAPPNAVIYAIHNMHAIPVACDALTWYTEKDPYNPCAWNMLGLLQERMGLKFSAAKSFFNAYKLSDSYKDLARVNYGRLLSKVGNLSESIKIFREVEKATFNSGSGLALALFKDKQYEESYGAYEQALNWLTENESKQSDLLVALASMVYMFQGPDPAKTLLFQSIQLKPPSPWGLYATLSLGLLHSDLKLAQLVLKELDQLKDNEECLPHYALLLSYVYLIQGNHKKAVSEVTKLVHRHPNNPHVWLTLSTLLIRLNAYKQPAAKCAQVAIKLGRMNKDINITKVLCLVSMGSFASGNTKEALIAAQKAVHAFPDMAECWSVLVSVLHQKLSNKQLVNKIYDHIKMLDTKPSLLQWVKTQQLLLLSQ